MRVETPMGLQQFSSSLPTSYRLRNQREALVIITYLITGLIKMSLSKASLGTVLWITNYYHNKIQGKDTKFRRNIRLELCLKIQIYEMLPNSPKLRLKLRLKLPIE